MTRQTAYDILIKHLKNPVLLKHSLAVEATMRLLAARLKVDPEEWGLTGLLHDTDYDKSQGHPELHGILLFKLEPNSIPTNVEHAIRAHNAEFTKVMPVKLLDWALLCCDELTGIIMELAQKQRDKKLASLTAELVVSKIKNKHFAKNVTDHLFLSNEKLGIPVEELVQITLTAMQGISAALEPQKVMVKPATT